MINFQQAKFLKSASKPENFPPEFGGEIAVIGRSNSGKSSVLNVLTQQKKLARVSKTPGRTQLINFFGIDEQHRLVDLPGYGFAKVSKNQQREWEELIQHYLEHRESLRGLLLIMDIRHPLKPSDQQMLTWAEAANLRTHILLNKSDKLKRNGANQTLQSVRQAIKDVPFFTVQTFSALNRDGAGELVRQLVGMYKA
jgi:GTP-binding protein